MFTIRIAIPDLDEPQLAEIFSQDEQDTIRESGKQADEREPFALREIAQPGLVKEI